MRGKRAKQYRKLMHQYALTFNFHEPYQVLVDAKFVQDAASCRMDLVAGLERTLQGTIKPMITQCSMRHLYTAEPKDDAVIAQAKIYERRRCNHHQLEKPLNTLECLSSVVDPSNNNVNKHRYVVASQDSKVRDHLRRIPGVPIIYIRRSVMILEQMANATEELRDQEERGKFRAGLVGKRSNTVSARKHLQDDQGEPGKVNVNAPTIHPAETISSPVTTGVPSVQQDIKRKRKGTREPNPLSVKRPKKREQESNRNLATSHKGEQNTSQGSLEPTVTKAETILSGEVENPVKKKRRRKHKSQLAVENAENMPVLLAS